MKIVVAPDSFKGCCSAEEAAAAMREGILQVLPECEVVSIPLADGGEGTMRILVSALQGAITSPQQGYDALRRSITVCYGYLPQTQQAIIEAAETIGLPRLKEEERSPMHTSSYGFGHQIAQAYMAGHRRFLIGLGGTATCDGGRGMLQAMHEELGTTLPAMDITVLCDVSNPLYGPEGAAYVFAPQKGAKSEELPELDQALRAMATDSQLNTIALQAGAGAGGGLGFALVASLHAKLVSGSEYMLKMLHFIDKTEHADLILTGEGKMDGQTLGNKLPCGVLHAGRQMGVAVVGIAGRIENRDMLLQEGFMQVHSINPAGIADTLAMQKDYALNRIATTAAEICSHILPVTDKGQKQMK